MGKQCWSNIISVYKFVFAYTLIKVSICKITHRCGLWWWTQYKKLCNNQKTNCSHSGWAKEERCNKGDYIRGNSLQSSRMSSMSGRTILHDCWICILQCCSKQITYSVKAHKNKWPSYRCAKRRLPREMTKSPGPSRNPGLCINDVSATQKSVFKGKKIGWKDQLQSFAVGIRVALDSPTNLYAEKGDLPYYARVLHKNLFCFVNQLLSSKSCVYLQSIHWESCLMQPS